MIHQLTIVKDKHKLNERHQTPLKKRQYIDNRKVKSFKLDGISSKTLQTIYMRAESKFLNLKEFHQTPYI